MECSWRLCWCKHVSLYYGHVFTFVIPYFFSRHGMDWAGLQYWGISPSWGFLSAFTPFYLLQTPVVLSWVMRLGSSATRYPWSLCSSNSTSTRRRWYTWSISTGSCALQKRAAEEYLELQLFGGLAAQTNVLSNGIAASTDKDPFSFCRFLCVLWMVT